MNKFKADFSDNKLWLDIPRPRAYEFRGIYPGGKEAWEAAVKAWNSRLSYSLSPELKAMLTDGQVVNENEFALETKNEWCMDIGDEWGAATKLLITIAIPLPEQTNKVKERLFTLEDMRQSFRFSRLKDDFDGTYEYAVFRDFMKDHYSLDIENKINH